MKLPLIWSLLGVVSAFRPTAFRTESHTSLQATWSDPKAVREYQDFLASGKSELELMPDKASVIIKPPEGGDEELANALLAMGMGDDVVLRPGDDLPEAVDGSEDFPIYITLRPPELVDFLNNLPESFGYDRRDNFVFVAGGPKYGNIEDLLKTKGYCRDTMTQFLITGIKFSKIRPQDQSVNLGFDAQGEEKWAGECAACGKWNGAVAQRLERAAIRCRPVFYREWRRLMWERNILDAVLNLIGAVRDSPTSLADVALYYNQEVSDVVWGISSILRGGRAITLTYGFEERIFGVAEANGVDVTCELLDEEMYPYMYKQFELANEFLNYMHFAQEECGLLKGVSLPMKRSGGNEIMRQGNLRADGVL